MGSFGSKGGCGDANSGDAADSDGDDDDNAAGDDENYTGCSNCSSNEEDEKQ